VEAMENIKRTMNYFKNRIGIGGHRAFLSKSDRVMELVLASNPLPAIH
jgi:hypothetical protein